MTDFQQQRLEIMGREMELARKLDEIKVAERRVLPAERLSKEKFSRRSELRGELTVEAMKYIRGELNPSIVERIGYDLDSIPGES